MKSYKIIYTAKQVIIIIAIIINNNNNKKCVNRVKKFQIDSNLRNSLNIEEIGYTVLNVIKNINTNPTEKSFFKLCP